MFREHFKESAWVNTICGGAVILTATPLFMPLVAGIPCMVIGAMFMSVGFYGFACRIKDGKGD